MIATDSSDASASSNFEADRESLSVLDLGDGFAVMESGRIQSCVVNDITGPPAPVREAGIPELRCHSLERAMLPNGFRRWSH
jgi:hypothetical protein